MARDTKMNIISLVKHIFPHTYTVHNSKQCFLKDNLAVENARVEMKHEYCQIRNGETIVIVVPTAVKPKMMQLNNGTSH